jgi:hypothetical protein
VLLPLAVVLSLPPLETVALIGSVVLVLIVELVNSSIEAAIDRISFDHHRLSGRAKDLGSAAVFLADSLVTGAEYRQKPDNLASYREDDTWDLFAAWFPVKRFSMTVAYADLGQIAMKTSQHGWYLSLQGSF